MDEKALLLQIEAIEAIQKLRERERVLELTRWLPSQEEFLGAFNALRDDGKPLYRQLIFTGPNQTGKTHLCVANIVATARGFEPWSRKPRRHKPPVRIAVLLEDFDNHAMNMELKFEALCSPDEYKVRERTHQGAPRMLEWQNGSIVHFFTRGQDDRKKEGLTWHELHIDEPCDRADYIAISRGLQRHDGQACFYCTPISEPWMWDEVYSRAGNIGGEDQTIYAITAFPDENKESHGGYLPDEAVESFRSKLTEEEREARVHGRWMHLSGRIYSLFRPEVHVIDSLPMDENELLSCPRGLTVDPHDGRPFAMAWFYILPGDDIVFYDEWPREPFEECRGTFTIDEYVRIMRDGGPLNYRFMDPNYGRRKNLTNGLTIAECFQVRSTPEMPLAFNVNILDDLEAGHAAVRQRLWYDKEKLMSQSATSQPLGPENQPKLYVMKRCRNTIKGMLNYVWDNEHYKRTGKFKPKEKFKDFADLVRYTVMGAPTYSHLPISGWQADATYRYGWQEQRDPNNPWRDLLMADPMDQGSRRRL